MYLSNFLIAFAILVVAWALDLFVLHFTGGLIHILLAAAAVCLIFHFLRGRP